MKIAQYLNPRDVLTASQQFQPAVTVFMATGKMMLLPDGKQPTVAQERFF